MGTPWTIAGRILEPVYIRKMGGIYKNGSPLHLPDTREYVNAPLGIGRHIFPFSGSKSIWAFLNPKLMRQRLMMLLRSKFLVNLQDLIFLHETSSLPLPPVFRRRS